MFIYTRYIMKYKYWPDYIVCVSVMGLFDYFLADELNHIQKSLLFCSNCKLHDPNGLTNMRYTSWN